MELPPFSLRARNVGVLQEAGWEDVIARQQVAYAAACENFRILRRKYDALKECHTELLWSRAVVDAEGLGADLAADAPVFASLGQYAQPNHGPLFRCCGSMGFFAPDMLDVRGYDATRTDVWSLGCLGLELALGSRVFADFCEAPAARPSAAECRDRARARARTAPAGPRARARGDDGARATTSSAASRARARRRARAALLDAALT
ncbi:hypothetical protein SO694_00031035 [Aureococcus anophagefferens]|uniref:Protein kinase domain-containing protein n=1 Tax=Aureococcus anophagefferens TaxID=44056 RepID=A0ABR1FJG3_AURAN